MKIKTPETAAANALKQLISHAQKNRGTIIELADRLSAKTGQTIYRQYVEKWLHPDPAIRVEPKLGIGLLLIEEGNRLIGKAKT